jgi:hypothetical protein
LLAHIGHPDRQPDLLALITIQRYLMKRKIILPFLMFFLMSCLLTFQLPGQALPTRTPTVTLSAGQMTQTAIISNPTAVPVIVTLEPTTTPYPGQSVPADVLATMTKIQQQVAAIRGLGPLAPLKQETLSRDQLGKIVSGDFFADYTKEDAANDARELVLMGAIHPGFDLYQFYLDLYSEQIAGFYDPASKYMYVVQGESFGIYEQSTYAHEFTHSLQDQHYDLLNGLKDNDFYCKDHTEYCAAIDALTEGDATLTQQNWLMDDTTAQQKVEYLQQSQSIQSPVFDSAPPFFQQDMIFPYEQGLNFVTALYDQDGYKSIDEAFLDPPVSTEQILHPEKYPSDKPVDVYLPDFTSVLGNGWQETDRNVMGEWSTYEILADGIDSTFRLPDDTAKTASAGWAGDSYLVYWNSATQQSVFVMRSRWETSQDTDEFWKAMSQYGQDRWGTPISSQSDRIDWQNTANGFVTLRRSNQDVIWLITPDAATADKIMGTIQSSSVQPF